MAIHLGGFLEDQDPAGAFVNIAALQDDLLFTEGDNLRVPSLNRVLAVAGGADNAATARIRLSSPTLDAETRPEITPLNQATGDVEPGSPQAVMSFMDNPLTLGVDEQLKANILSNPSAAASQWALLWFSDGAVQPVTAQNMQTVRGTGSTTVTAQAWSSCNITLDEDLTPGNYQLVGLRVESATAVAGRVVFRTGSPPWRPGCLGTDSAADLADDMFRFGRMGIWGGFPFVQLPGIEFLCNAADSAQVVYYDLIKIGG